MHTSSVEVLILSQKGVKMLIIGNQQSGISLGSILIGTTCASGIPKNKEFGPFDHASY